MGLNLPKTPSFDLTGKTALVTGAGRGIGLAAAAALAQAGADVTLAARTTEEVRQVAEALCEQGYKASHITLDVMNVAETVKVIEALPPMNILVSNAGTNRPKPITDVDESDYDAVLDLNLKGAYFLVQAVTKKLIEHQQTGSIIHMSSQMGQVGAPNRTLYCASKWAVEGLNKALAVELAGFGIRSNTIAPTFVETPLTKPFFENKEFLDSVLQKIKLGRLGQVEDLMGGILFLASDASSLMTGSTLTIDGGWTAE